MTEIIWTRGEPGKLSKNFSKKEFECRCGRCVIQKVNPALVEMLEAMRALVVQKHRGEKIFVSSGYRCPERQKALQASGIKTAAKLSQHELGNACDIHGYAISGETLEAFARQAGFRAVGVASRFIHVDTRSDKFRRWTY